MEQFTIAAFVPTYAASLSRHIYDGISRCIDHLKKEDIELVPVFFDGGYLSSDGDDNISPFIYNYGNFSCFDGILIFGSIVAYNNTSEVLNSFCKDFGDIPIVNIGLELEDFSSVTLNDYKGMFMQAEHMLSFHGFKKPFFLQGPEYHSEAQIRRRAYEDCLKKYGIFPHEQSLFSGDFTVASGKAAADYVFSGKMDYKPDCVISSNDEMAFGFISRAEDIYGVSIPDDISIGGFDNSDFSESLYPTLTTINQPFGKMAENGCLELISKIRNHEEIRKISIDPELVIRKSCGCRDSEVSEIDSFLLQNDDLIEPDISSIDIEKEILDSLLDCLARGIAEQQMNDFVDMFTDYVEKKTFPFTREEQKLILQYLQFTIVKNNSSVNKLLLKLFISQALMIFQKSIFRREWGHRVYDRDRIFNLSRFKNELDRAVDLKGLQKSLNINLGGMDITSLGLFLFDRERGLDKANAFYLYQDEQHCFKEETSDFSPLEDLVTDFLKNTGLQNNYMLSPLIYKEDILGVALFDVSVSSLFITKNVSVYISEFIHNYRLMDERSRKTRELEETVSHLKQIRGKLLEAEKQAALGKLVAGISHELNTPMGNGISAVSFMQSKLEDINYLVNNNKLKKSDLVEFLSKSGELSDILVNSLQKASKLLENFKKLDIETEKEELSSFLLYSTIDNALSFFSHNILRKDIRVHIDCDSSLTLYGHEKLYLQVFKSLIENSIEHGFPSTKDGSISINCSQKGSEVHVSFQDDGEGIPKEELPHIFEPFFTTERGEGAVGLGLHIVYILIHSKMGGTITVESNPGEKTVFHMKFPRDSREALSFESLEEQNSSDNFSFGSFKDLASQLVHDLNTPLGVSLSLVSLLNDAIEKKNGTPVQEISGQLFLNLERIRETLQNFKDICSDDTPAEMQVIPLREYIEGIIGSLSTLLKEKKVSVKLTCPKDTFIKVPSIYLFRIMSNLITNSLFHAFAEKKSERLINIDIRKNGSEISIVYSDNGRGISEETLENIFKPYFTTGKKKGRSGLGMFIIYKLITEYLKGHVECSNSSHGGFLCRINFQPEIVEI